MSPLFACVCAREFPAQALLRLRPELRAHPCVVMQGEPPAEQVCALNTPARLRGMRPGMSRVEVETFAGPAVLTRSLKAEAATRNALLECAGACSPRVEDRSEDTLFLCCLDIAGTGSLFGPPETLGKSLLRQLRALGVAARVAISANLHAAECLARSTSGSPMRLAAAGHEAEALAPLPLSVLPLDLEQAELFTAWGIRTLGMLAALPEKDLAARMGQRGLALRRMALGVLPRHFEPRETPLVLEERYELDFPLESLDSLMFGIARMLEQLVARAHARLLALAAVTLTLELDGGAVHTRRTRPAQPGNDRQFWVRLLHLDLQAHPPGAAVLAVVITAEPGETGSVQLGLFSPQLPEPGRLDVTLAQLTRLVGDGNAGRAALLDTHASENFRVEPFCIGPIRVSPAKPYCPQTAVRAALRRLRPPEPARVEMRDAQPGMFHVRGQRYAVEQAFGPWFTSGAWWSKEPWASEQWAVEQWDLAARTAGGDILLCCLHRDRLRNHWHMAGLYD